jgi:hypothetical protein
MPSTNYSILIFGMNQLGEGDMSRSIWATSSTFRIDPPVEVLYDAVKRLLLYQSPSTNLCARVEIHQGKEGWDVYEECADPAGGSVLIREDWVVMDIRVALCLIRRPEVCSPHQGAQIRKYRYDISHTLCLINFTVSGIAVTL